MYGDGKNGGAQIYVVGHFVRATTVNTEVRTMRRRHFCMQGDG